MINSHRKIHNNRIRKILMWSRPLFKPLFVKEKVFGKQLFVTHC
jgi:hypothetical protein